MSFFIFFSFYVRNVLADENCQLAIPRYGTIKCYNTGQIESIPLTFTNNVDLSISELFSCLSNCELSENDISFNCSRGQALHWEIYIDGNLKVVRSLFKNEGVLPVKFERPSTLTIKAWCRDILFKTHPVKSYSVSVKQDKIMLEEARAGSLDYTPIPGTEGCTLNSVIDKYRGDTDVSSYYDPTIGKVKNKPSSTYTSVNEMPTNWKIGDSYVYVSDWQTGIADISVTYDKDNNPYWCGGLLGHRVIYNVKKIISKSGSCYAIPTSIYKSNVECCFPSDCSWKGVQYTCDPGTWSCEETRWCDSQLDCDQVFGEGVCQNKEMTSWVCDTTKPWGDHKGTCIRKTRSVSQCPSDCTSDEYYNQVEGVCKPRSILLDCPPGECCVVGGNYKPRECPNGLTCCRSEGLYVGECKQSCGISQTENSNINKGNGMTGYLVGMSPSIWIIIGLFIVVIIGVGLFFILKKPKKIKELDEEEF